MSSKAVQDQRQNECHRGSNRKKRDNDKNLLQLENNQKQRLTTLEEGKSKVCEKKKLDEIR